MVNCEVMEGHWLRPHCRDGQVRSLNGHMCGPMKGVCSDSLGIEVAIYESVTVWSGRLVD